MIEKPHLQISVIIPTWRRAAQLRGTLERILDCDPPPGEVWVHVDAEDEETPAMLAEFFSARVRWVASTKTMGPGGGRNVLAKLAQGDLLVSLDDDSWPVDLDSFTRVGRLSESHPGAAVFAAAISLPGEVAAADTGSVRLASCFENCGCVIRRDAFLATRGYLPLRHAYGMEEADLALQILDAGWEILHTPELRVYHDTKMTHHASPEINAAHITNTALLAFLRYPKRAWPLGVLQVINRVRYAVSTGRIVGILHGVTQIPGACRCHRAERQPVKPETLSRSRRHR